MAQYVEDLSVLDSALAIQAGTVPYMASARGDPRRDILERHVSIAPRASSLPTVEQWRRDRPENIHERAGSAGSESYMHLPVAPDNDALINSGMQTIRVFNSPMEVSDDEEEIADALAGSSGKRKRPQPVFETRPKAAGGGGGLKYMSTSTIPTSMLADPREYIGGADVQSSESTGISLRMNCGKRAYKDPIPSFLQNLSGNGTVRCEWNGIVTSKIDERKYFFTLFRHRFANTASLTISAGLSQQYQSTYNNMILTPVAPKLVIPMGSNNTSAATAALDSGTYVHQQACTYLAPLNRPDYEDMSWNLNKLKLAPTTRRMDNVAQTQAVYSATIDSGTNPNLIFHRDNATLMQNAHRKCSSIEQNNCIPANTSGAANTQFSAPYKYNMVFNYGVAHYNFLNKETTGCKVEVIVYKWKKGHAAPYNTSAWTTGASGTAFFGLTTTPTEYLTDPVGIGWVDTKMKNFGTDDLTGRVPSPHDVKDKPYYPFCPKLRATKQSNQPWAEVMRNTFVLPAGGRRAVDVQFPGEIYDPANVPLETPPAPNVAAPSAQGLYSTAYYSLLDKYTYGVMITVNGCPVSRNLRTDQKVALNTAGDPESAVTKQNQSNFIVGDVADKANLQYYCVYTEHIGACQYQDTKAIQVYVNGDVKLPPTLSGTATAAIAPFTEPELYMEGVTILPVSKTVRAARTTTHTTATSAGTAYQENSTSVGNQGPGEGSLAN